MSDVCAYLSYFPIVSKLWPKIFIQVFLDVAEDRRILEDLDEDMEAVTSSNVATMFVELTDPLRVKVVMSVSHPILKLHIGDAQFPIVIPRARTKLMTISSLIWHRA